MVIFVTDVGMYWNHENPILEKYADNVVVVCIYGEKVTNKYKCIVSPYKSNILGCDNSMLSAKYRALESIKEELRNTHTYHDDILFLTDNAPGSLYPYLILKDMEKHNRLHLWCMSPWMVEPIKRRKDHHELMHDISKLNSLLYVDSDMLRKNLDKDATFVDLHHNCENLCTKMLPKIIYEINTELKPDIRYYYDFKAGRYIETSNSYQTIINIKSLNDNKADAFVPKQKYSFLGKIEPEHYPDIAEKTKETIQQLSPRLDGKRVCEELKKMRKTLAEANGIEYEIVECPSVGPCAGTCRQCDKELRYLQMQLEKIPKDDRVYPQFEIHAGKRPKAVRVKENPHLSATMGVIVSQNAYTQFMCPDKEVPDDE